MITVKIKGDLAEQVAKAMETRRAELEKAVEAAAEAVKQDARRIVAVSDDPPHIRDNIEVHQDGLHAEVGVFDDRFNYGTHLEFGTSSRQARPFMTPAVEVERKRFEGRIREAVQ